jgi:hypothetical protein
VLISLLLVLLSYPNDAPWLGDQRSAPMARAILGLQALTILVGGLATIARWPSAEHQIQIAIYLRDNRELERQAQDMELAAAKAVSLEYIDGRSTDGRFRLTFGASTFASAPVPADWARLPPGSRQRGNGTAPIHSRIKPASAP